MVQEGRRDSQKSGQLVEGLEVTKEKELINEFFKEASVGGLATYGLKEVMQAIQYGKVKTLLVSEDLEKKKITLDCPQCKKKQEKIIDKPLEETGKCPSCGAPLIEDDLY